MEPYLQLGPLYSIFWHQSGSCVCHTEFAEHQIDAPALIFSSPYQKCRLFGIDTSLTGTLLQFHGDFYCIEKHKKEVACNGIIFNNIYSPPFVRLDETSQIKVKNYLELLENDLNQRNAIGWKDMAVAHLKILLIIAARLKLQQQEEWAQDIPVPTQPVLQEFQRMIEQHFRQWHTPAAYAEALGLSTNALARMTRKYLHKAPSALIHERIIQEAKRALHFSTRSVKEIAYDVGYEDFGYFGRIFKKSTGITPTGYRRQLGVTILE